MQSNPLAGLDRPPSSEDMARLSVRQNHQRVQPPPPPPLSSWLVWLPLSFALLTAFGLVLATFSLLSPARRVVAQRSYHVLTRNVTPAMIAFLENEVAQGKKVRLLSPSLPEGLEQSSIFFALDPSTPLTPGVLLDATVWVPEKQWKIADPAPK